jgi:hypothetical protein
VVAAVEDSQKQAEPATIKQMTAQTLATQMEHEPNQAYVEWFQKTGSVFHEESSSVHLPIGHKVFVSEKVPEHEKKILPACEILAKEWGDVFILPNAEGVDGIRSPDICVAGKLYDIKVTSSYSASVIRDHIKTAKEQCGRIVFYVQDQSVFPAFRKELEKKLSRTDSTPPMETVIIQPDKKIWIKKMEPL